MVVRRLSQTIWPALSSAEVLAHIRSSAREESALVTGYLTAAQEDIEIQCQRALTVGLYRVMLDDFPCGKLPVELEMCPVRKLVSVKYYDASDELVDLTDEVRLLDEEPGTLHPVATSWPATYCRPDAVMITFWAGHLVPIRMSLIEDSGSGDPEYRFESVTGYPVEEDDELVITKSGNNNTALSSMAVIPDGLTESQTVYALDVDGNYFDVASTVGGDRISLSMPSAACQAIDLLFAGVLPPFARLALLKMTAMAFEQRCAENTCACSADSYESDPMLRRLKWNSPVRWA